MRLITALALSILPSPAKLALYRMLGMKIGRHVRIGFATVLLCDEVELDDGARIGFFCLIRLHTLKMGKRAAILNLVRTSLHSLVMRSQSTICSRNELSGDRGDRRCLVYLGPGSWVMPHCFIDASRTIRLGRNVGVGGGSYLFTHGMWLSQLHGFPVDFGDITIESDVWLSWGCFIMPNVSIGSRVVIGAGAVVNRSIPADALAAGVPAKVLRDKSYVEVSPEERARILVEISESIGAKTGAAVRIERTATDDRHFMGGRLVLVVHKQPSEEFAAVPALNVIFSGLDRAEAMRAAVWSLHDFTASPYGMISADARHWLFEARVAGIRFYPIDEDFE